MGARSVKEFLEKKSRMRCSALSEKHLWKHQLRRLKRLNWCFQRCLLSRRTWPLESTKRENVSLDSKDTFSSCSPSTVTVEAAVT
jgi:hypothetical protein